MDSKSFWLLNINSSVLSVSLVNYANNAFIITAIGSQVPFTLEHEAIVAAVDSSLAEAAKSVSLPEKDEPNTVALILPPLWIGTDGKIVPQFLKLIENICRDLSFKPMGFIANDEAIVEDANHSDGFPASFVLANISDREIFVSLTYLGKVIERISKPITSTFNPSILESALVEFKTESTLPPQIIIFGDFNDALVESIKNYPWVGKKNLETFLHFPDIKTYTVSEITQIYTRTITSQFSEPTDSNLSDSSPEISNTEIDLVPEIESEPASELSSEPEPESKPESSGQETKLTEVSATDLGFTNLPEEPPFSSDNLTVPESFPKIMPEESVLTTVSPPRQKFKLPRLPKIHLPAFNLFLIPLVISPLLILIPFLFSTAKITLYLTPYNFNKQVTVTLDPNATSVDALKNIIPVNKQTFTINSTASQPTTGQKTIGNKASGEVTIFNQQSVSQKLSQGAILIDSQGNRFTLANAAVVASSSANLDLGVITLGQTKVTISAADIGPEYNLAQGTQLHFKDYPETVLIAKVDVALSGGTKSQVSAVSAADKTGLEQKMNSLITTSVNDKIKENVNGIAGLIQNSVQISKGRIDYSREVGEETDTLTATAVSTINVFSINPDNKTSLIKAYLASEPGFSDSTFNSDSFNLSVTPTTSSADKIKGLMTIEGTAIPQVDTSKIIKLISGKSLNNARTLIKSAVPRVYNFEITTNFTFLQAVNPLPFRAANITLEIK